jgi:hypothetical protein
MSFEVGIENYLSFEFQAHLSKMLSLSISNPKSYEETRQTLITKMRMVLREGFVCEATSGRDKG